MFRIDPRLAMSWLSPTTVRFGRDVEAAVIDGVDARVEHAIAVLRLGASHDHVAALVGRARADRLLAALAPTAAPSRRSLTVAVPGSGRLASTIRGIVTSEGHALRLRRAELVVPVASGALPRADARRLLASDRPHLPVVAGDGWIDIGPLVVPGSSACHRCGHLADLDADPVRRRAWGAEPDVQLGWGEVALAAGQVARILLALSEDRARPGTRVRIDRADLSVSEWIAHPHPACGCGAARETVMELADHVRNRSRRTASARAARG